MFDPKSVLPTLSLVFAVACGSRKLELQEPVGESIVTSAPVSMARSSDRREPRTASRDAGPRTEACPAELPAIRFETESDTLSADQDPTLRRIASCLTTAPQLRDSTVVAIGHTHVIGPELYNLRLGMDRALRVKAFLVAYGVAEERVVATTAGDLPNATPPPGRRVDLFVVTSSTSAP